MYIFKKFLLAIREAAKVIWRYDQCVVAANATPSQWIAIHQFYSNYDHCVVVTRSCVASSSLRVIATQCLKKESIWGNNHCKNWYWEDKWMRDPIPHIKPPSKLSRTKNHRKTYFNESSSIWKRFVALGFDVLILISMSDPTSADTSIVLSLSFDYSYTCASLSLSSVCMIFTFECV